MQGQVPNIAERPLQPGDKLKVTIWREPDLSGEFEVQPDGSVTFPKIGRVQVDRLSTDSLTAAMGIKRRWRCASSPSRSNSYHAPTDAACAVYP
jgi:protein involved in polysaccharide export with SLBB domain